MTSPDWLSEATTVWDEDEERWVIRSIGPDWVEIGHTERGAHRIRRRDLVEWVEHGDWSIAD